MAASGNDEFYTPDYAVLPLLEFVDKRLNIWCPFDQAQSRIVRLFQERGNPVTATHIEDGADFFAIIPPVCDVIISNPPYSKKTKVFQRLFEIGKPFAMLVGVAGLFESEARFSMFAEYDFEIMWLSKRVSYLRSYDAIQAELNPPFSSVWLTRGLLPKANVFRRLDKPRSKMKQLKE